MSINNNNNNLLLPMKSGGRWAVQVKPASEPIGQFWLDST